MIKNFFVLDPVGELLCFEEEFNRPGKSVENRASLIYQYDEKKYGDIMEIIENVLPSNYIIPLLNGIEMDIKNDIKKRKKKHEIEIKARRNKSLKLYEDNSNNVLKKVQQLF